jgi:Putative collagen-binding domain of a collagenase
VSTRPFLAASRSGEAKSLDGWAYCAATESHDLVLLYFERACPQATLSGLPARREYQVRWFDPRTGRWLDAATSSKMITVAADGTIRLPPFPGGKPKSDTDWALKLR